MNEVEIIENIHELETKLQLIEKAYSVFSSVKEVPESLKKDKYDTEKKILRCRQLLLSFSNTISEALPITEEGNEIFIIMPFKDPFNEYYEKLIKPAILELNYVVVRSDEIYSPSSFVQTMWEHIIKSKLVIAEMTYMNPNVLYELGLCHAINKTVIMISQSMDYIPADLRHINCIIYSTDKVNWIKDLTSNIQKMVLYSNKNFNRANYLNPVASVENTIYLGDIVSERDRLLRELETAQKEKIAYGRSIKELLTRKNDLESLNISLSKNIIVKGVTTYLDPEDNTTVYCFPVRDTDLIIEMVKVEQGEFIHGMGQFQEDIFLDTFYISRFSITNKQYVKFLNYIGNRTEDGYKWINLDGVSPCDKCRIYYNGNEFMVEDGYEDHPVTYVNYYGANAFCQWADGELPTEEQWEKAVRGADGRTFPWGNDPPNEETCNYSEDGWARTVTPIEVYKKKKGRSPFGLIQGIGNVWHWTRTYYADRDVQAVRGGSFFDFRVGHRSVYRFLVQPNGPDFSQSFLFFKRFLFFKE